MTLHDTECPTTFDPVLPGAAATDDRLVGGKAAGLSRLAQLAVVPEYIAVPTSWLPVAAGSQLAALARCGLDERGDPDRYALLAQRELASVQLTEQQRTALPAAIERYLPGAGLLAVRSSAATEDGLGGSEAGAYASMLQVSPAAVEQALLEVWRSWWSSRAVTLRARRGQRSLPPQMGVVIQRMLDPEWAGVVITAGPRAEVESVAGPASALVSGEASPEREGVTLPVPNPRTPVEHAAELGDRVRTALGAEADVEWAWCAGQLYSLQARPVVASDVVSTSAVSREPMLQHTSLYGLVAPAEVLPLDGVGDLVARYRQKRRRLYALAEQHGCLPASGVVLRYNRRGLNRPAWTTLCAELGEQVVVDLDEQQRQHIVPIGELTGLLRTAAGQDPHRLRTVVVRGFRAGAAVVSSTTDDGRVRVDYAEQGLFALNRGWGAATALELDGDGMLAAGELPAGCSPAALRRIAAVTQAFVRAHGPAAVEWVLDHDQPVPMDYSPLDTTSTAVHGSTLGPGSCSGPALMVPTWADERLAQASAGTDVSVADVPAPTEDTVAALARAAQQYTEPPVLVVDRPYAILATLIGHVAGVVVGHGSPRLCHLAILLREYAVPAAELPKNTGPIGDGDYVAITDGQITTTPTTESRPHDA